jgi:hypothetical protein
MTPRVTNDSRVEFLTRRYGLSTERAAELIEELGDTRVLERLAADAPACPPCVHTSGASGRD